MKIIFIAAMVLLLIFADLKVFSAWDQVSLLWDSGVNPFTLQGDPHMPRYLLTYPGFLLKDVFDNYGFSLYIFCFFVANLILFRKVSNQILLREPSFWAYGVFMFVHLFMNGRGPIAWSAWLICCSICIGISHRSPYSFKQFIGIAASCWMAAVSTGVFVLVALTYLTFIIKNFKTWADVSLLKKSLLFMIFIFFLFFAVDYFLLSVKKNIDFYGGGLQGFLNMLNHGIGVFLRNVNLISIFPIGFSALTGAIAIICLFTRKKFPVLDWLIVIPLLGGLFGYMVLMLVIPLFLLRLQLSLKI